MSDMLRAPLTRLILLALWSLAVIAAIVGIDSHRAERSAYPSTHIGARP